MNRVKFVLIIALALLTIFLTLEDNINPDSQNLFKLKRLKEKAYQSLKVLPDQRVDYLAYLLPRRLGEIKALVENKKSHHLWHASLRYSTTAGELTKLLVENNMKVKSETVKILFKDHQTKLAHLLEIYPKDFNNEDWKFIQDDINYLNFYLEDLAKAK